jgi:membrane protein YqaA with SNARE-associated domain
MARITKWVEAFALSVGGPGLFIIAFLDSSFLSFPEVNDLLIVLMVINHPERMLFYASMATLGSIAGCLALYFVGRKGGHALLEKRFKGGTLDRASHVMRKYGAIERSSCPRSFRPRRPSRFSCCSAAWRTSRSEPS